MFYYKFLDLPPVPDHFLEQCLQTIKDTSGVLNPHVKGASNGRPLYKNGKLHGYSSGFGLQHVSEEFDQWVRDNLVADFRYAGVGSTTPGRDHCGPHRDQSRDYSLLYLVKTGGDDSCTQLWKKKIADEPQNYYDNYDDFDLIEEIRPALHQWYLLNSKVVHSVENIKEGRISVQVSLLADQVPSGWIN
jgi:hypothetical protein